jgi:hypothetical protein
MDSMGDARTIDPNNSGRSATRGLDRVIAGLGQRQHGVVSRAQLLQAGFCGHLLDHKVVAKRLHVLHLGVYAVGHRALSTDGRRMAATLAAGPGAVLSHRAAGGAWGLIWSDHLEVTAPSRRARPGIVIHRSRLETDEVTTVRGIPVTGPSRTLFDLAAVFPFDRVEQAVNQAEVRGLRDSLSLNDLIARYPARAGVPKIREILERLEAGATLTRSDLEDRFLAFVHSTGLPPPRVNANLLGFECDCVWPNQRVVVELDGHATRRTTAAFERDRARDRALNAGGWRTIRVTWRHLHLETEALAVDLTRILGAPASR